MPILEVEIVVQPGEALMPDLAARLADAAAAVFGSPARGTWVRLKVLDQVQYAENDMAAGPPVYPIFVSVLKSRIHRKTLAGEAERLADLISRVCGRPKENVHNLYLPESDGRMAFGGKLVKP